ncbi:MAG: hypothetical protein A4E58_00519 [Syntrophorhabdus sp. PtaB.Bin006]|nr:MAG: hypothetical protein A4E58_00519 [Syntrophorhabdus sp. PtaB.Bin006]
MTVNVLPAIVSVVVLEVVLVLAAIEHVTAPLPDPLLPEVILNHEAPLAAVQEHPVCVVTGIDPVFADAGTVMFVAETE